MAREGISTVVAAPTVTFVRRATVATVFNMIFAIGLAFFWLILRDYGPSARNDLGDHAVWIFASLAHLWYYSPERWHFKVLVTCVSLVVNAVVLTSLAKTIG